MAESKESITIYLTTWQKRMLKDFTPGNAISGKPVKEISTITILKNPKKPYHLNSYRVPTRPELEGDWSLYLTDEQAVMVREQLGLKTPVSVIRNTAESIQSGAIRYA